jgi:hypothetical protein
VVLPFITVETYRALARPPPAVKTVLEAVSTMLGSDKPEWGDVRKVIAKQDFISTVVHFNTDTLDARVIRAVEVSHTGPCDAYLIHLGSYCIELTLN